MSQIPSKSPAEEQAIARIREEMRKNLRSPVSAQSIHKMLFRISLKDYCDFLAVLPPVDDTDYSEVYKLLLEYSRLKADSGSACLDGKKLTVGLMLQKANDLIYHDEEYRPVWDADTQTKLEPSEVGEYIVDVLLIKPVVLIESERRSL